MDRQQMLSILSTMSEDNLAQALSAVGVEVGMDEMDLGDPSAEGLESWNARDVSMEDPGKPMFLDKSKFTKPAAMPMRRPDYMQGQGEGDMDGIAEFITQQQEQG